MYDVQPGSGEEKYFVEDVIREARLQAMLKHPYVTKVFATPLSRLFFKYPGCCVC